MWRSNLDPVFGRSCFTGMWIGLGPDAHDVDDDDDDDDGGSYDDGGVGLYYGVMMLE